MVQERVSRYPRGATLRCPVCQRTGTVGQITGHCGKAKGCKGATPEILGYPEKVERVAVAVSQPDPSAVPAPEAPEGGIEEWDPDADGMPWDPPADPEVIDLPRVVEHPRSRSAGKADPRDSRGRMARATTDGRVHADLYILPTTNALIAIVSEDRQTFPFVAEPRSPSQVVDALVELALRTGDPAAEYELGLIRRPRAAG